MKIDRMAKSFILRAAMAVFAADAAVASAAGDVEATTNEVTAQFLGNSSAPSPLPLYPPLTAPCSHTLPKRTAHTHRTTPTPGASGGLKLLANDGTGTYIMAQQAKLEEVDADGKKCPQCFSLNVAGKNEWTPLAVNTTEAGKEYSTTFTVLDGGDVSFSLTAHLAESTMTTTDVVPCSNCTKEDATELTSLPGVCERQNCVDPSNSTGKCIKQCVDAEEDGFTCRKDFALCTESVTIQESQLKFSFVLGGVVFKDPTNKLTYGLSLKTNANATEEVTKAASGETVTVGGSSIEMPTTAIVKAWDKPDREVQVTITTENKGDKLDINFEFPAMEEGDVLYYDPTLSVPVSDNANSASCTGLSLLALGAYALL